jgi:23S rRNA (pseudouridine1915-N3)-methyltransferase
MRITIASVSQRKTRGKSPEADTLVRDYVERSQRLEVVEATIFDSEESLLAATERASGRPAAQLWLFDSRGEPWTSEEFATALGKQRDTGAQRLLCAIGPADGWSPEALARAHKKIAFGRMTLPHELARVIAAEQVYRALTILAGHPYHCGH